MLYAANAKARSSACFAIRKLGLVDILTTLSTRAAVLELDFLQDLLPWHTPRKTVPGIRNPTQFVSYPQSSDRRPTHQWMMYHQSGGEKNIAKAAKGMKLLLPKIMDDFMDAASHAPLADCASGMIATVAVEVWISAAEAASAGQRGATRLRRLGWI